MIQPAATGTARPVRLSTLSPGSAGLATADAVSATAAWARGTMPSGCATKEYPDFTVTSMPAAEPCTL